MSPLVLVLTLITPFLAFTDALVTLWVHIHQIRIEEKHDEKLDKISRDVFAASTRPSDFSATYQPKVHDPPRNKEGSTSSIQRNMYS